jgi:hypothetical protein
MFRGALIALALAATSARAGDVVWQTQDAVTNGQDRTFVTKGTRKGEGYLLRYRGLCKVTVSGARRSKPVTRELPDGAVSDVSFRAHFGGTGSEAMPLGDAATRSVFFFATEDDVPVRIVDEGHPPGTARCAIDQISVERSDPKKK